MNRTTVFRRMLCITLALLMTLTAAVSAGADETLSSRFTGCKTIPSLFEAAEAALKDGADPAQVYDEMCSAAEGKQMLREFRYALENAAAYGSKKYEDALAVVETDGRKMNLGESSYQKAWDKIGFDPYGHYEGSDAFRGMITDPGARYCLEQAVWSESDFQKVFGTAFNRFRPARPRPGYVCLVITDRSQSAPETGWDSSTLKYFEALASNMIKQTGNEDMKPVFTGNPDLASSFWVYDLAYPFYAWYGRSNRKEVRGFNCTSAVTVFEAANHRQTAKLTGLHRLGRTIYEWHDWIAKADVPILYEEGGFAGFVSKVETAAGKQFESEDMSERILPVNAANALNSLLLELAEQSTDAWYQEICRNGARDVAYNNDSISFSLRSFDPGIRELGAYSKAEDGSAWLQTALKNASAYNLKHSLALEDGRLAKQAKTSLINTLKKAASTAQNGFGGKDMAVALADRLFPSPVEGKIKEVPELLALSDAFRKWYETKGLADTGLSAEDLAIICYAQKGLALNAKAGPHNVELTCTGGDLTALVRDSAKAVLDDMAYAPAASRASADQADDLLREKLAEAAIAAHARGAAKYSVVIDLDELAAGKNPTGYLDKLNEYDTEKKAESAGIRTIAANFPEAEAQAAPKAGKLQEWTTEKGGARASFELAGGADPTYLLVLSAKDNSKVVSAFITPGKKQILQLPEGEYRFAIASGKWWYGEEELFAANGSYWISEAARVQGGKNASAFILDPESKDGLKFEKASPEDFR